MAAGLLAACGGGGGSGGSSGFGGGTGGGGTPAAVADLTVALSKTSVANNSDGLVDVTVTSIDANRVAVGGAPVSFAINSGGVITPAGTVTDASTGVLKAVASLGVDRNLRTIKITVTSGSIVRTINFDVVDSVNGTRVADLAVVLSKTSVANDGDGLVDVTVTTVDSNRVAVGGAPIAFAIDNDGVITAAGISTDAATGVLKAVASLGAKRTSRKITVTVSSGTLVQRISFDVVDSAVAARVRELLLVVNRPSVANTGDGLVEVTATALDVNRAAVGGAPVTFAIDNEGVITPAGTSTAAGSGTLKATASFGSKRSNRTIKVTATSGTVIQTVSFDVVDSTSGARVADLAMTLDRPTIPNDGTQPVRVTVTSLDASRQVIGGSPVVFLIADPVAAELGRAFVSAPATTDAVTGQLVANVNLGSAKTNRSISLTATSGTVTRTVSFSVVDAVNPVPVASDLALDLDRTNIGNAGSEFVTVTATVVDARRNVVAGAPVTFSSDTGNVTVVNSQTNANGQAKAEVRIAGDKSQRLITVTASSGTLSRTAAFAVTGVTIQATVTPALPAAGSAGNKVEYRVVDVNQSAMVGIPITVTPSVVAATAATGPVVQSGVTNANGAFVYTYTAPATPGPLGINAVAAGQTNQQTVTIPSASTVVPNATSAPSSPTVSVSPSVVRVNVGTDTSNRAEIRALFLEPVTNKPVRNVRVRFDLNGDPLNIGGTVAAGNSIVYTDANGVAVTSYAPGTRSSPTNGLTIRVCWSTTGDETTFPVNTCPNAPTLTSLTVVADPLSVSIGTDNSIQNGPTGLTYIKQFVLLVVDAAGNPKADVQLTPVVDLRLYRKGFYTWNPGLSAWILSDTAACTNEDTNRNGVIDTSEDLNGNSQLDPRKSDVAVSLVGGTRTDANGTALMKLEYPKSFAGWIDAFISVTAAGVLSPPATIYRRLDVEAQALKTETPPPAFQISPFGTGSSCNNAL